MKKIEISPHAYQQMAERGALEAEVMAAVQQGEAEAVRMGRVMYRKIFPFDGEWRGRRYRLKQVAPVVAEESDKLVVVTVYVFYH